MIGEFIELSNGIEFGSTTSINNLPAYTKSKTVSPYKATVVARNKEVCKLEGRLNRANYDTLVSFEDETYTIKSFGQSNTIESIKVGISAIKNAINDSFKSAVTGLLPRIYDNQGNEIGKCEILTAGSGLQVYRYYKYIIKNTVLYAYELSHDTTDILYCIYNEQNQMVATVSKDTNISHGHARYTIYSCNEEWFKYIVLVTTCWSINNTVDDGGPGTHKKEVLVTVIPELLQKYNPTFIDQVKQKEGITHLPENMNLVNQKIEEAKKGKDVKLSKFMFILVFGIIFVIMLISFFK